ncbi:hypothetical protein [Mesobacillus jeotgali]|uniref:hypothetical protein n=1 Tax=Mesobacillus jeotgali TaxID=129985 RepID=UPI0009A7A18E|nr:hypothetical protein [Mesobacillus jeotgali]
MKNNLYQLYYDKPEDRVTEVLFKLLEKSTKELTDRFLGSWIGNFQIGIKRDYHFGTQLAKVMDAHTKRGVVLAISESGKIKSSEEIGSNYIGVPDGYIYESNEALSVLVEIKIKDNPLTYKQLDAHCQTISTCNHVDIIPLTWREVRDFFEKEQQKYDNNHKNWLLIDEFQEFCDEHEVGRSKEDYQYLIKRHAKEHNVLRSLDEYIKNKYLNVQVKKDGFQAIDYKTSAGKTFFTIWYKENLIVFKPTRPYGVYIDLVIHKLGGEIVNTPYDYKSQEAFMLFSNLKEEQCFVLSQIIDLCYESTCNKIELAPIEWVNLFQLTEEGLNASRIGRADINFFNKGSLKEAGAYDLYHILYKAIMEVKYVKSKIILY